MTGRHQLQSTIQNNIPHQFLIHIKAYINDNEKKKTVIIDVSFDVNEKSQGVSIRRMRFQRMYRPPEFGSGGPCTRFTVPSGLKSDCCCNE